MEYIIKGKHNFKWACLSRADLIDKEILELFKKRDGIENFNKKSLYILIREMTNVNTSQITRVTNIFKKYYTKLLSQYDKYGTLADNKNKFF